MRKFVRYIMFSYKRMNLLHSIRMFLRRFSWSVDIEIYFSYGGIVSCEWRLFF